MQPYEDHGPVHSNVDFSTSHVQGKTAVVTGGANGIGEAYVRHLVRAGAFVVFGDIDESCGRQIESELGRDKAQFVVCDVTQWKPQLAMFKHALAHSPNHRVDIVIANAGIAGFDDVFHNKPELEEPEEPMLNIVKVNGLGVMYTSKLALHYFHRQFQVDPQASQDQLLILQGSLAGYVDLKGAVQYGFCKWGMRGMMRNLRRTEHAYNTRVNYIAPGFVKTKILNEAAVKALTQAGVEFATVDEAARAVMKMCSDPSINGRTFAILPSSKVECGYLDLNVEQYDHEVLNSVQQEALGANHRLMPKEQQAQK